MGVKRWCLYPGAHIGELPRDNGDTGRHCLWFDFADWQRHPAPSRLVARRVRPVVVAAGGIVGRCPDEGSTGALLVTRVLQNKDLRRFHKWHGECR